MAQRECGCGSKTFFSVCPVCHKVRKFKVICEDCCVETKPKCLSCAIEEVEAPQKVFLESLSDEQKYLFEQYDQARKIKTSMIILD